MAMWVVITLVAMVCTPLGAQAHHSFAVFDIDNKMEVSVIQLRHDEFPRYETTGFPYYVNVFVLMASSFLFVTHFAFSDFSAVKGVKTA